MNKRAFALAGVAGALSLAGLLSSCGTVGPAAPVAAKPVDPTPKPTPRPRPPPAPEAPPQAGQSVQPPQAALPPSELPPAAPREFRAAWVSTVANIDWPSRAGLSVPQQQAEALAILDKAKALNLNAIVLQVRPSADAIYSSTIEPWTEYLTGTQGKGPQPWYDPLKFWIAQAHARGLELHAWFNPYRARHATAKSPNSASHVARTLPSAVKNYGRFQWMDPGDERASRQTLDVILDVVRRYDIDGVHLDDYFYPYPIDAPGAAGEAAALDAVGAPKAALEFPDQPSWQRYLGSGGRLDRAGWRRQNVNQLIERLYAGIKHEKSWVKFGISPFGLGRPDRRPAGIVGFSQYDLLYADAELWLENGWLDYLSPQLYWPIRQAPQAYGVLLDYWIGQNRHGRHVWPGLFTSRIGAATKAYQPAEITQQIGLTRTRPSAGGHVHFSMAALMGNRQGISDQLKAGHYAEPALVPATPWLGNAVPETPDASGSRAQGGVLVKLSGGSTCAYFALWSRHGAEWRFAVVPAAQAEWLVPDDRAHGPARAVFVSAIDRLGNESALVMAPLSTAVALAR